MALWWAWLRCGGAVVVAIVEGGKEKDEAWCARTD